jgi:NADPH:quinone reductase-like Zn-dependent oxidoreductase
MKAAIAARLRRDIWPALETAPPPLQIQRFPLTAAPEAHRLLEARDVIGKLVLVTGFGAGLPA